VNVTRLFFLVVKKK